MNIHIRHILTALIPLGALAWSQALCAATQTANPASCINLAGTGTVAWNNPANAVSSNGSYATASVDGTATNYLRCTNYGFTIPAGATINGITVNVERRSSSAADGGSRDAVVRLIKGGVIGTSDRATATVYPTADAYEAHGGAADRWGTSWMPSDINTGNFGAAFAATKPNAAGPAHTISVDHIQITVDYTPGSVINTYFPGNTSVATGATSITLGAASGAATPISAGDLLIVMQIQGATIDTSNTASYGTVSTTTAGNYEYVLAANGVGIGGGTLNLTAGLKNSYTSAAATATEGKKTFQVIRVPVYASYIMGALTAQAWNGATGGVLAFDVTGALNLNSATSSVDGMGFRGGVARTLAGGAGANTDYRTLATVNNNGGKGEGIAGTPRYVFTAPGTVTNTGVEGYPNGSHARGAPANAGGGGTDGQPSANDRNTGGGGGSNAGAGGMGGIAWCPTFNAGNPPYYSCPSGAPGFNNGGLGGAAISTLQACSLTQGGGGGGATTNNGTGTGACDTTNGACSSGAAGGGIIIVRAGSLSGNGVFSANGANADNTVSNDGSGGGGAGGAVLVYAGSGLSGLTINAAGGYGGTNLIPPLSSGAHGPGGGGGGGYVITSAAPGVCSASGGANGNTYNSGAFFGAYGAASGNAGTCTASLTAQTPGALSGLCANNPLNNFAFSVSSPASTCGTPGGTPSSPIVTITARDVSNATLTSFTGTVTLSTSTSRGKWFKVTGQANGVLAPDPDASDDGSASYTFSAADNGVAQLYLTNGRAEDMTITGVSGSVSSTSAAVQFRDAVFVLTPQTTTQPEAVMDVVVAGRPHQFNAAFYRKDPVGGTCGVDTDYTGAKNLDAWYNVGTSYPAGAAAPWICTTSSYANPGAAGCSNRIPASAPASAPASNNLPAITFTNGMATLWLDTDDTGQYSLNLRDDTRTSYSNVDVGGTHTNGTMVVRPFALYFNTAKKGGLANPKTSNGTGAKFIAAGDTFEGTVSAVRWLAALDANSDGNPDVSPQTDAANWATAASARTAAFASAAALSRDTVVFPVGGAGTLSGSGTTLLSTGWSSGQAMLGANSLSYNEVGSMTVKTLISSYLGINYPSGMPWVSDVVGRFYPDHFDTAIVPTATTPMPCPTGLTCPLAYNGYVYSGQPFSVRVTAKNLAGNTTVNYDGASGLSKDVTLTAWDALGSIVTPNPGGGTLTNGAIVAANFSAGIATTALPVYTFPSATTAPTDIYLRADDIDGVSSRRTAAPGSSVEGGVKVVSGRVKISNAHGSELLLLPMTATVQYWNAANWVNSSSDSVTSLTLALSNYQRKTGGLWTTAPTPLSAPVVNGILSFNLSKPTGGGTGSVDVSISAPNYLLAGSNGAAVNPSDPGRATFGVYKGANEFIYLRENY